MEFKKILRQTKEYGIVEEISPPIITCSGLPGAMPNELVVFENNQVGQVLSLSEDSVEVIMFSDIELKTGVQVTRTGTKLTIPVGEEYLGKVINPLGSFPFPDQEVKVNNVSQRDIEVRPLKIKDRQVIDKQLTTGMTLIDIVLPIGKGQRELIVGDRKTGKTSAILTSIISQAKEGMTIVYAVIGKKKEEIKRIKEFFAAEKIEGKIIIVATSSQDSPSLIELTPYSAMTIAEYFRDKGEDTLVILDDLTTHAKFYREIALIGKRFPGRESFPGDIFYKHAKLLERAGNYRTKDDGQVSISCLPVAETIQGNLTDHIVSNLISITDGHILFDNETFNKGRRPAINLFLSVTRVGKQTQDRLSRRLNQEIMSFLIRYEKALEFSHFGTELSQEAKDTIDKGSKIYKFFEQGYTTVVPLTVQKIGLGLIWFGYLKNLEENKINQARKNLMKAYVKTQKDSNFLDKIADCEDPAEFEKNLKNNLAKLVEYIDIEGFDSKPSAVPSVSAEEESTNSVNTPTANIPSDNVKKIEKDLGKN